MQFAVENSKEKSVKQREIELWISRNKLPDTMKMEVKENTQSILLEENQDVDTEKLLHHLSINLQQEIKQHLCLPLLKKVPNLERQSDTLLQLICNYLKPVSYNEDSYIVRQGEPLDRLLLFTQGIAWKFTTTIRRGTVSSSQGESIENGHFIGEALLVWGYNSSSLSNLPTSPHTVKTHTKVEAFALMAKDLKDLKTLVSGAALAII
ncbi:Cyclic nucleotide-gated ion channel 1 [Morella rubra]|uniref:Cyclic nucleotide-gated ion channel 1 n=1 Tax=Morella rubra TaxID=262757 RepID=A0A6A1VR86_9ROSI|nr:Cyclic nucleotide-gated ion channel 1 [Morella rubra]KAB1223804.1 Cyclic nucleotide-gated ion channel 1 [Morella rubra]